jgi:septum formation protein
MIVLASKSPRRSEILRAAGIPFVVRTAEVDESLLPGEEARHYVMRLAKAKALAVEALPDEVVLGADTTVVAGSEILGKPEDAADARRMLLLLSGRRHQVMTGVCLRRGDLTEVDCAVTDVQFAAMTTEEIEVYAASGEPLDKAGGYAIQGFASRYIERIDGDYSNVVGLPVSLVYRMTRRSAAFAAQ